MCSEFHENHDRSNHLLIRMGNNMMEYAYYQDTSNQMYKWFGCEQQSFSYNIQIGLESAGNRERERVNKRVKGRFMNAFSSVMRLMCIIQSYKQPEILFVAFHSNSRSFPSSRSLCLILTKYIWSNSWVCKFLLFIVLSNWVDCGISDCTWSETVGGNSINFTIAKWPQLKCIECKT